MMENLSGDEQHSTERTQSEGETGVTNRPLRWGANLVAFAGVFLFGHGLLFLYRTYFTESFEAGVHDLGGVTRAKLGATHPEVLSYIDHLHVNLAATYLALGVALAALAWYGIRRGRQWAWATAVALPVVFLPLSLGVHQTVAFDYHTLTHLGPAGIGAPIFVVGAVLAYRGLHRLDESSKAEVAEQ